MTYWTDAEDKLAHELNFRGFEMTQDESIRMAREAGLIQYVQVEKTCVSNALERFAAIVAAHEREKIPKDFVKACEVLVQEKIDAVLAEREACAKLVEAGVFGHGECAAAIRARNSHEKTN